jgi:hypothetical protein
MNLFCRAVIAISYIYLVDAQFWYVSIQLQKCTYYELLFWPLRTISKVGNIIQDAFEVIQDAYSTSMTAAGVIAACPYVDNSVYELNVR